MSHSHGYAEAICYGSLDENGEYSIHTGDRFSIDSWQQSVDEVCIWINSTQYKMTIDKFFEFFERKTGL